MSFAENYSFIDRTLHQLAFNVPGVQKVMADLETSLNAKQLSAIQSNHEVFVTGLPRSGTTLLLDFLFKTDEFCTYSYRHMPFILSPLLWKKISKPFSKKGEVVERAHGDGMDVSFDSPEAFEEVIWLSYLKDKYVLKDRLEPLTLKNTSKAFADRLTITLKKLILDASSGTTQPKRYISKNNANCSRIDVLNRLFPQSTILIPFREPLSHIGSLMKQHQQFCEMHKDDEFAKSYMRWLGHYDFGENFKPINFDDWYSNTSSKLDFSTENAWLEYWVAGYTHLLKKKSDKVHLVDYNKLLIQPMEVLSQIASKTKLNSAESFLENAKLVRAPTSKPKDSSSIEPSLLTTANNLYSQLQEAAL